MGRRTSVTPLNIFVALALLLSGCGEEGPTGPPADPLEPLAQSIVFEPTWVEGISGDTVYLPSIGDWDFNGVVERQAEMLVAPGTRGTLRLHSLFYAPLSVAITVPDTIRETYLTDVGVFRPVIKIRPIGLTIRSGTWSSDFASSMVTLNLRHLEDVHTVRLDSVVASVSSCVQPPYALMTCTDGGSSYRDISPAWGLFVEGGDTTATAQIDLHREGFPTAAPASSFPMWLVYATIYLHDTAGRKYRLGCGGSLMASAAPTECTLGYDP